MYCPLAPNTESPPWPTCNNNCALWHAPTGGCSIRAIASGVNVRIFGGLTLQHGPQLQPDQER